MFVCLSVCLFVPRDLVNRWTDMALTSFITTFEEAIRVLKASRGVSDCIINEVTGCLFVQKNLANRRADMILLYNVAPPPLV